MYCNFFDLSLQQWQSVARQECFTGIYTPTPNMASAICTPAFERAPTDI